MKNMVFFNILLSLAVLPVAAGESRADPIDMYLIIDGSAAFQSSRDSAVRWLCDYTVDKLLREGDRLTVWLAAGKSRRIFSETLDSRHTKESVKALLRGITLEAAVPDYAGALRDASELIAAGGDRRMSYTLLAGGSGGGLSPAGGTEMANLLRYSRVREFAGWRAIVTAPGIGPQVRKAASAFMN